MFRNVHLKNSPAPGGPLGSWSVSRVGRRRPHGLCGPELSAMCLQAIPEKEWSHIPDPHFFVLFLNFTNSIGKKIVSR